MWSSFALLTMLVAVVGFEMLPDAETPLMLPGQQNFYSQWPVGDARRCLELSKQSDLPVKRFGVLPGVGWDNLRNLEAGQVVSYNYSQCKLTDDGTLLIPDNVFTVPIKISFVETFAELYESWQNTSSTTSRSVNVEGSLNFLSISGKYSTEYVEVKCRQIQDKAMTVRVQLRYNRYQAKTLPDPILHPRFKQGLLSIAANVELNRTAQARYEAQVLVRDFGTHVLTSVTAGAGLFKDDYIKSSFFQESSSEKTKILAEASLSFVGILNISLSSSSKDSRSDSESYKSSITQSYIRANGGPIFQVGDMTLSQWISQVDENLVAMDRSGEPLYNLITLKTLPEVPPFTVAKVERIVRRSVELYYELNTISGCTKPGAPNFSFSANYDDGTCNQRANNLTFGGVYQTCVVSGSFLQMNPCDEIKAVNPRTGGYSCPPGYKSVLLYSGTGVEMVEYERISKSCGLFYLSTCYQVRPRSSRATYQAYWCMTVGPALANSGYLFGGLFTPRVDNLLTGQKACPALYRAQRLLSDLTLCLSDDHEQEFVHSIPFAGFFSCNFGNPLSAQNDNSSDSQTPQKCPEGYSQHLATDELGCSIYYCIETDALSGPSFPAVKLPPFMKKPPPRTYRNDSLVVFDPETLTWLKNEKAQEFLDALRQSTSTPAPVTENISRNFTIQIPTESSSNTDTERSHDQKNQLRQGLSGTAILGMTIGAFLFFALEAAIVYWLAVKKCRKARNQCRVLQREGKAETSVSYT